MLFSDIIMFPRLYRVIFNITRMIQNQGILPEDALSLYFCGLESIIDLICGAFVPDCLRGPELFVLL